MSIFKDTFRDYVRDQLSIREELIGLGNTDDRGVRSNRRTSNKVTLQSGKTPTLKEDSYYNYTLNKQCGIRMTSLVDYVMDVNLEIGGYGNQGDAGFQRLKGATLSQNFILEGGVLSDYARNLNGKKMVQRSTTPRESFPRPGLKTNLGYGDLGLGADATPDGYGIVPMPGITNATIRTKSAYGSLREAKINFECHNRRQLEVLEMLYMRPGYMALVEWGWAPYIKNTGNVEHNLRLVEDFLKIGDTDESLIYTNDATQQMVYNAINSLKEEHAGNYDGFLGFVKNFGFEARDDGGFSCFTEMISMGEVLDSLKPPNTSAVNTTIYPEQDPTAPSNVKVSTYGEYYDTVSSTAIGQQFDFTAKEYDIVIQSGILPEYGGLEGLTKAIKNYATFNDFTLGTPIDPQIRSHKDPMNEIYGDDVEAIFPNLWVDIKTDNEYEKLSSEEKAKYDADAAQFWNYRSVSNDIRSAGDYMGREAPSIARDILRFQAASIQEVLIKKLSLESSENLRNYIIPRGGFKKTPGKGEFSTGYNTITIGYDKDKRLNDQPFIRWDALCVLINTALIPVDEDAIPPITILADKFYDVDDNKSILKTLNYVPITEYDEVNNNYNTIDFSADANTCILPHQVSGAGAAVLTTTLGYSPDITVLPIEYTQGLFAKVSNSSNRALIYNNTALRTTTKLNKNDSQRRIGSIFLNINMIDNIATKNANNPDYTVGNFINDIWKEVNKVCPNHNFVLVDDKESTNIYIIDLPVDNTEIPLDLHTFEPFSNKNVLRSFNYTSNIPSALSSTIAIQSQNPRSIQDIDGVTFSAFNRAIKNRLLSKDITPSYVKEQQRIREELANKNSQRLALKKQIDNYRKDFFLNLKLEANNQKLRGGNISGILREYQQAAAYIDVANDKLPTFNSVIPLEFNAELDGISGMVIGNLFKIKKDRLPKAYQKTNIGFIVFNEEQKITAGGDWTTEISGKMTILPDPNKPKKTLKPPTPPDINEDENKISEQTQHLQDLQITGTVSQILITPQTDGKYPGEEIVEIRIEQNPNFEPQLIPPPTFAQNEQGANVESIIPNRIIGGRDEPGVYTFTIEKATFQINMTAGNPVTSQQLTVPRIDAINFSQNRITLSTAEIDPSTGTANYPGAAPPPQFQPSQPIVIELVDGAAGYTSIIDSSGNRNNLIP